MILQGPQHDRTTINTTKPQLQILIGYDIIKHDTKSRIMNQITDISKIQKCSHV